MPRKVILDVDPGIDDAVALTMALFDPRLEVVAVTAVAGNVFAEQATRNVQAIIERLDPPRWPRLGAAQDEPGADTAPNAMHIHGATGLGDARFEVAELRHRPSAEKVLIEEIRRAPDEITIVALGPLTNVAGALRRDPAIIGMIGQIVLMGGTVAAPGNVTAAAEFNIGCHPQAAREVFHSRITKTVIPLDVTTQVVFAYDFLEQLPSEVTRAGSLLRKIVPFAFRSHRQSLGLEGIHLHDAVALVAVTDPELFTTERRGNFRRVDARGNDLRSSSERRRASSFGCRRGSASR